MYFEKTNFQTKNESFETVSQRRKCERVPLGFFNIQFVAKYQKNEGAFWRH